MTTRSVLITTELQALIDRLAAELGAAVGLEDGKQRRIAYSAQHGPVDRVRRDSILRREAGPDVVGWFAQFGIGQAREPVKIPPSPELDITGRVCAPVRYADHLLGFLFVLDEDGSIFEDRLDRIVAEVTRVGLLLYESRLADRLRSQVVSHLLSDVRELQVAAAASIADRGYWPRGARVCAVVMSVSEARPAQRHDKRHTLAQHALVTSLEYVTLDTVGSASLHMAFTDHAVLLLPCWSDDDERPSEIGRLAVAALERRLGEHAAGLRVAGGTGDPQADVDRAHVSYRQARLAAKVAGVISTGSTCPRWRDLGVFRTLAQLPSWDRETDLDPRVQALFREADPDVLRSVETYLDLGCDVQRTSGELNLHRGTLYYRLDKAEKLSGLRLRDGNDRLSLHLGFKIARLAGRYPA